MIFGLGGSEYRPFCGINRVVGSQGPHGWDTPTETHQGPSQEELLVMALREAHVAASALNALECPGLRP
jgi:hypothetical protein